MESPTHFSETNVKRYKGIRNPKKRQHSCADFQLKENEETDDVIEMLGPRSISLTALTNPVEGKKGNSSSRMTQLETLEAKMAKIEVSLSNLGLHQQQQGGTPSSTSHQHLPQRRKRSGTRNSAGNGGSTFGGNGIALSAALQLKENEILKQNLKDKEHLILNLQTQLRKLSKKRMLHGSITSTDSGVVSLRILNENEKKGAEERLIQLDKDMDIKRTEIQRITDRLGQLDPSDNIDINIEQAELEYDLEREELNLMNLQEERRNLHTLLDDNDAFTKRTENSLFASIPENMGVALHSFEIAYNSQNPAFTVGKREDRNGTYVTWTREDLKTLKRGDRIVELNGTIVISKGVNRVEEFWSYGNGCSPLNIGAEDGPIEDLSASSLRIVVIRSPPPPPPPRLPNRELLLLKEEISHVSTKLEDVNKEKNEITTVVLKLQKERSIYEDEIQRNKIDSEMICKERDLLKGESLRLKHRISYLEDQVAELLNRKDGASSLTIFQKGNQKTIVGDGNMKLKSTKEQFGQNPAPRPQSVSSSRNESKAFRTRLWETFRRATTSDSRSVCSMDSRHRPASSNPLPQSEGVNILSKKRSNSEKKLKDKPIPPLKPIRLSLQKATSTTNVYTIPSDAHSVHQQNLKDPNLILGSKDPVRMSPSIGINGKRSNLYDQSISSESIVPIGCEEFYSDGHKRKNAVNSSNNRGNNNNNGGGGSSGLRWPSFRPASSMSYTMSDKTNPKLKF